MCGVNGAEVVEFHSRSGRHRYRFRSISIQARGVLNMVCCGVPIGIHRCICSQALSFLYLQALKLKNRFIIAGSRTTLLPPPQYDHLEMELIIRRWKREAMGELKTFKLVRFYPQKCSACLPLERNENTTQPPPPHSSPRQGTPLVGTRRNRFPLFGGPRPRVTLLKIQMKQTLRRVWKIGLISLTIGFENDPTQKGLGRWQGVLSRLGSCQNRDVRCFVLSSVE